MASMTKLNLSTTISHIILVSSTKEGGIYRASYQSWQEPIHEIYKIFQGNTEVEIVEFEEHSYIQDNRRSNTMHEFPR